MSSDEAAAAAVDGGAARTGALPFDITVDLAPLSAIRRARPRGVLAAM